MVVSKNNGTPKSSILIGFSTIFTIHFGFFPPYFWVDIHILISNAGVGSLEYRIPMKPTVTKPCKYCRYFGGQSTVDGSEIRRSPPGMVLKPCK